MKLPAVLFPALALVVWVSGAKAQAPPTMATVVSACGIPPGTYSAGTPQPLTQDTTGTLCASSESSGTVTSVSVVTVNGISGTVANPTTTPAITLSLNAITPTSVGIGAGSVITSSGPGGSLTAVAYASFGTASGNAVQGGVITAGGPTGSATVAPIITYNAAGQLTAVSSATITPAIGSVTGLGTNVATALGNPAGGSGGFALFSQLSSLAPTASPTFTGQVLVTPGTAANPAVGFVGAVNYGLDYAGSTLLFDVGGNDEWQMTSNEFYSVGGGGPALFNTTPTGAPSIVPDRTDNKVGIGMAATSVFSIFCDESSTATECARFDTSGRMTIQQLAGTGSRPVCITSAGLFEAGSLSAGLTTCP